MTSKTTPNRLVANPCVSVSDLVKTFKSWLDMTMDKDLFALLAPPGNTAFTWKTGPNHQWLARVAPLFIQLTKVAPNTVLTSKKMILVVAALRSCGAVINTTKMNEKTFDDWCDQTVRILFAKFREIKKDKPSLERVLKRCTQVEAQAIQEVLKRITIGLGDVQEEHKSNVTLSPPKSWGQCGTISSSEEFATDSQSSSSTALIPKEDGWCTTDVSIFQRVLEDNAEDKSEDTKKQQQVSHKSNPTKCNLIRSSPPPNPKRIMRKSPDWKMTLHTPPEHKSTDSESINSFDEDEQKLIQTSLKSKIHKNKPTKPKAKAKAKSTSSSNSATTTSSKVLKKGKLKKVQNSHLEQTEPTDEEPSHKVLLKRFTSAAYHKTLKLALADGKDDDTAKEEAREAYKKAADEFNSRP